MTAFPAKSHWQQATGIHYVSRTDEDLMLYFSLGDFVTHPDQPDWGHGQVQSIVGKNVTVNFEHAGKQMINCQIIGLVKVNSNKRD